MSFNVRVPMDSDGDKRWTVRRTSMVALIKQAHPDVFGTQELVQEQAQYLASHLPAYRWFGRDDAPMAAMNIWVCFTTATH